MVHRKLTHWWGSLIRLVLLITICSLPTGLRSRPSTEPTPTFVTPGLAGHSGKISAIVTGTTSTSAARAVEACGGKVTSELWLIHGVGAKLTGKTIVCIAGQPNIISIVENQPTAAGGQSSVIAAQPALDDDENDGKQDPLPWDGWVSESYRCPVPWDGTPDVRHAVRVSGYRLAYPMQVDLGISTLDVTGSGITVAILDSGIYFNESIRTSTDSALAAWFEGQADFVDTECPTRVTKTRTTVMGTQYDGYCLQGYGASRDPYGHGTHVSRLIKDRQTEVTTGDDLGIASGTKILSVRVLDADGSGTYENVIKGIQFVVENQSSLGIRVMNMSLSAEAQVPYFVDPLNRAVEAAWASGITVVAAAGNSGPEAESITVPGNDPYIITVGAIDGQRTAAYWHDDIAPTWTASGPTADGFVKPDVLAPGANIVSVMYSAEGDPNSASLARQHPDHSSTLKLFRMSGTSMATAITSGVVALMLEAHPELTPDQVKYRLMATARPAMTAEGELIYNVFQQGAGRIWPPDAVYADVPTGMANAAMDIGADLAHGGATSEDLAFHYQGPVRRVLSDDGQTYLYYAITESDTAIALGMASAEGMIWSGELSFPSGMIWAGALTEAGIDPTGMIWAGGLSFPSGMIWAGALPEASGMIWSGGMIWAGAVPGAASMIWAGGLSFPSSMIWAGALTPIAGTSAWSGGIVQSEGMIWAGMTPTHATATTWVE